jgi:hypothetical protein
MFYTSLSLSSSPLHLLGGDDIPTYRKVHQVVMQPIRSQKLGNASGGDAVNEITKTQEIHLLGFYDLTQCITTYITT